MSEFDKITIRVNAQTVDIRLVRNPRARTYRLRVGQTRDQVTLTMPVKGSLAKAQAFARQHEDWLAHHLDSMPDHTAFAHGSIIPLRGLSHEIRHVSRQRGLVWVAADGDDGTQLPIPALCVAGEEAHVARRLQDWLKAEAKRDIQARVAFHSQRLGVQATGIAIRDTTSRWGSCSAKGRLNFSWRLIMAPPFVLDYLAAHEVAHLREMNHSSRFWALVAQTCTRWQEAEAWLKREGRTLYAYGPPA